MKSNSKSKKVTVKTKQKVAVKKSEKSVVSERNIELSCAICLQSFVRKLDLANHKLRKHPESTPHTCQECNKRLSSRQGLWRHKKIHKRKAGILKIRPKCDKKFSSQLWLNLHIKTLEEVNLLCTENINDLDILFDNIQEALANGGIKQEDTKKSRACKKPFTNYSDNVADEEEKSSIKKSDNSKKKRTQVRRKNNSKMAKGVQKKKKKNVTEDKTSKVEEAVTSLRGFAAYPNGYYHCVLCDSEFGIRMDFLNHIQMHIL